MVFSGCALFHSAPRLAASAQNGIAIQFTSERKEGNNKRKGKRVRERKKKSNSSRNHCTFSFTPCQRQTPRYVREYHLACPQEGRHDSYGPCSTSKVQHACIPNETGERGTVIEAGGKETAAIPKCSRDAWRAVEGGRVRRSASRRKEGITDGKGTRTEFLLILQNV